MIKTLRANKNGRKTKKKKEKSKKNLLIFFTQEMNE